MLQKLQKRLKEQKGFTLIELLAVIVILGILAAIAIPSILGIINHSKQDAHVANAQQIANSAKLYIADEKINISTDATNPTHVTLQTLTDKSYIDTIKDPSGIDYSPTATEVFVLRTIGATDANGVKAPDTVTYKVSLISKDTGTAGAPKVHTYYNGAAQGAKDASDLQRSDILLP